MLKIRLTRVGKKNSPAYRVVVAEQKKAVKRDFIEILGHYNPTTKPKTLVVDKEKTLGWIKKGAQPTATVNNLLCDLGILDKKAKVNVVYGRPVKKKDKNKKEDEAVAPVKEETTAGKEDQIDEAVVEEAPADEATAEEAETTAEPVAEESSEAPVEEK